MSRPTKSKKRIFELRWEGKQELNSAVKSFFLKLLHLAVHQIMKKGKFSSYQILGLMMIMAGFPTGSRPPDSDHGQLNELPGSISGWAEAQWQKLIRFALEKWLWKMVYQSFFALFCSQKLSHYTKYIYTKHIYIYIHDRTWILAETISICLGHFNRSTISHFLRWKESKNFQTALALVKFTNAKPRLFLVLVAMIKTLVSENHACVWMI